MRGDSRPALLDRLLARVNYERQPWPSGEGLKLELISELACRLGNPHLAFPVIHVAGTKGKGSTTRLIADIFQAAGFRTASYSSPHLESFNERFNVDGSPASSHAIDKALESIWPHVMELDDYAGKSGRRKLTFFDISTALAFLLFARATPDVAVLETGLGGRLDSTNICQPAVAVITSISLDHCRQLGSNVVDIATEKAGIIKPGVPVICGVSPASPAAAKILEIATSRGSPVQQIERDFFCRQISLLPESTRFSTSGQTGGGIEYGYDNLELAAFGEHSARNASIAIAAASAFQYANGLAFSEQDIRTACTLPGLPGRIEVVSTEPMVVLDVAHNPASAEALVNTFQTQLLRWNQATRRTLLVSISRDKDQREIIRKLLPAADRIVFTRFQENPRATEPGALAELACQIAVEGLAADQPAIRIEVAPDPVHAWREIAGQLDAGQAVCITGSIFLVAELRRHVLKDLAHSGSSLGQVDNA